MTIPVVSMDFNVLRIRFGATTHVRIDVTKLLGHQSWFERYGNRKWVIEFTLEGGARIVCEYDREEYWKSVLDGLDRALDQPIARGTDVCEGTDSAVIEVGRELASDLCEGCPPIGYPTDITRCAPCPRRLPHMSLVDGAKG